MIYVALLRGINVGTGRKVTMKLLKELFEKLGLGAVKTYINSGNVLFVSDRPAQTLEPQLEESIAKATGLDVRVLLRTQPDINSLMTASDASWTNDQASKTDVMFLWPEIDAPTILDSIGYRPELETMKYVPGAVFWHIDRKNVTKSRVLRMIGTPLYKQMTIRNINTLRKLHQLMNAMESSHDQ